MNIKDIFFYLMIFVICLLCLYVYNYTKSESYKCMNNPLVYGVKNLVTNDNKEIICDCYSFGNPSHLIVTKDNMTIFELK